MWQLLCGWWVTTADQSHPSFLYMYDRFFKRKVNPQMKKLIMTLHAGWLPPFFRVFCDRNCTLSACFFYRQVIIDHRCRSAVVTRHSKGNCLGRNHCGLIFKSKSWKLAQKYLKICYGNPKFFRSITWNPVYLSSISWNFPYKQWSVTARGLLSDRWRTSWRLPLVSVFQH
jgi:hypothetical protein